MSGRETSKNFNSRRGLRATALTTGILALAGMGAKLGTAPEAFAATLRVPTFPYKCPDDYLNTSFSPIQAESIFDDQHVGVPPYDQANLVVVHDNRAYDLQGDPTELDSTCVGTSFEQFQVGNSSYGEATGVTVDFSMPDDPAGSVHNPHNPAGNEILRVTQTDAGSQAMPDKMEKPVAGYVVSDDKTSVHWSLPTPLEHGQQQVYRVYYESRKPVVNQDYTVSVSSANPEINPVDNSLHFQRDIYPAQLNPADKSDQPRFSNGRIRRVRAIGKRCIIRPIRISAPKSMSAPGSEGLLKGRVIADVYYSKKSNQSNSSHRRIKVPFSAITASRPLDIPIRACDIPAQKFVDARISVTASNMLRQEPFLKGAHLVRSRKVHGKLLRGPAWAFSNTLKYPNNH